jgi:sulfatase modifying factor 1
MADSIIVAKALWAISVGKTAYAPALWEIELRVFDIIAEQTGICEALIHHDSRLIEDLNIDSLDLVELILAIEEEFGVSIPDDASRLPFVNGSVTAGQLAEIVRQQWGKGTLNRRRWFDRKATAPKAIKMPFTQLGGTLTEEERCDGELYAQLQDNEQGFPQFRRRTDGMRCILLPAAKVEVGSDAEDALPDQQPKHPVRISEFLIDAEPVSTTAFARFLNSVAARPEGLNIATVFEWCGVTDDDRRSLHFQFEKRDGKWMPQAGRERQPVVLVSWYGAAAYSLWANRRDWRNYKSSSLLPSEAQWEYAARGRASKQFPWGDSPATMNHAHIGLHTARASYGALLPLADVNARIATSPFGLLHMAGNVWNWCADWYSPQFYASAEAQRDNPVNLRPTGIRSERGGSWIGPAELAKSSYRRGRPPHARGRCLGFRCVGLAADL